MKIIESGSKMDDNRGRIDRKVNRKRHSTNPTTLDTGSIKKPQQKCHVESTLMDLNDDCLMAIFDNLNQIDLCHVQNVCTRFVQPAEGAFRSIIVRRPSWTKFEIENTISETRRIFYKFGHLFRSLHVRHNIGSDMLRRLTRIESLTLAYVTVDWKTMKTIHSAKRLKVLSMQSCTFVHDGYTSQNASEFPHKEIASLSSLTYQGGLPPLNIFREFLQYNQELKHLGLPTNITENYISQIVEHAKQLIEFTLFADSRNHTPIDLLLSNLKNLRLLTIIGSECISTTQFLKDIEQAASDITDLTLNGFEIFRHDIKLISKMKKLQFLAIRGRLHGLGLELVSLVASLPELKNVTLSSDSCARDFHNPKFDFNLTFDMLKGIVEAGKELNALALLFVRDIRINRNDYKELLDVFRKNKRTEKLSIAIEGCKLTTTCDVPPHVQTSDLKIDYSRTTSCRCELDNGLRCMRPRCHHCQFVLSWNQSLNELRNTK